RSSTRRASLRRHCSGAGEPAHALAQRRPVDRERGAKRRPPRDAVPEGDDLLARILRRVVELVRLVAAQEAVLVHPRLEGRAEGVQDEQLSDREAVPLTLAPGLVVVVRSPEMPAVAGCDGSTVHLQEPETEPATARGPLCDLAMKGDAPVP